MSLKKIKTLKNHIDKKYTRIIFLKIKCSFINDLSHISKNVQIYTP